MRRVQISLTESKGKATLHMTRPGNAFAPSKELTKKDVKFLIKNLAKYL